MKKHLSFALVLILLTLPLLSSCNTGTESLQGIEQDTPLPGPSVIPDGMQPEASPGETPALTETPSIESVPSLESSETAEPIEEPVPSDNPEPDAVDPANTPKPSSTPEAKPTASPNPSPTPKPTSKPTPEPDPDPSELPYRLEIDVTNQVVSAFGRDTEGKHTVLVRQMICSTGKPSTPTPLGSFAIPDGQYDKGVWGYFTKYNVWARYWTRIKGGILFHSIIYSKNDVSTLKKSTFDALGTPVSAGCIRLLVPDAKWIYDNIHKGTMVDVVQRDKNTELTARLKPSDISANSDKPQDSLPVSTKPTPNPSPMPKPSPSPSPNPSAEPTPGPEPTPSDVPIASPTPVPSEEPVISQKPTPTSEPAPSPEPSPNIQPSN